MKDKSLKIARQKDDKSLEFLEPICDLIRYSFLKDIEVKKAFLQKVSH